MIKIAKYDKGEEQKQIEELKKIIENYNSDSPPEIDVIPQKVDIESIKGAMRFVFTKKELENALKDKEKYIYIEGDSRIQYVWQKNIKDLSWSIFLGAVCSSIGSFFIFSLPILSATLVFVAVSGIISIFMSLKGEYRVVFGNANSIIVKRK
ncbi:MAG: hypothetical protein IJ199_00895 [Prevotella sp.]|nr:hypothetical protein [Prevotella sp.]